MSDCNQVPQEEVDGWTAAVAGMYYGEYAEPDCWGPAGRAAAELMSGWGLIHAPYEVLEMIRQAIETGYAKALEDVRSGRFDGELEMWRPDLPR